MSLFDCLHIAWYMRRIAHKGDLVFYKSMCGRGWVVQIGTTPFYATTAVEAFRRAARGKKLS